METRPILALQFSKRYSPPNANRNWDSLLALSCELDKLSVVLDFCKAWIMKNEKLESSLV